MVERTIVSPNSLRAQWPDPLAYEWAKSYSEIFDERDLSLALSQPTFHFYEWFAAIHLHQDDGSLSLIEKYGYGNHPEKITKLERLLREDERRFLTLFRVNFGVQPPDLLVYHPKKHGYWFAEVKGPGDSVSEAQLASWTQIEQQLGARVEVIRVALGEKAG